MADKTISRRDFLRLGTVAAAGAALAACATPTPQVIREEVEVTRVVEKEGETVIEVVTATPPPKEPVTIVATSQMSITTWDNSVERAKERLPGINLRVTQTGMPGGW